MSHLTTVSLLAAAAIIFTVSVPSTAAAGAGRAKVVKVPRNKAPRSRPEGTTVICQSHGGDRAPMSDCPVVQLGRFQIWAFSLRNNSTNLVLAAYDGGRLIGHTRKRGTRYLNGIRLDRRNGTATFVGQAGGKVQVSLAELERLAQSPAARQPQAVRQPAARRPKPRQVRRSRTQRVTLRSAHGRYVVAEGDGKANANRQNARTWETWQLIHNSNGTVSLKGYHGKYLVAEGDGRANANRPHARQWEQFKLIRHRDGTVSFRSHHGKYLVAEHDGQLNANRSQIGPWERFRMKTL